MSGETIRRAVIRCDADGCTERYLSNGSVTQVRKYACTEGWCYAIKKRSDNRSPVPTFDFCPAHKDECERYGATPVDVNATVTT